MDTLVILLIIAAVLVVAAAILVVVGIRRFRSTPPNHGTANGASPGDDGPQQVALIINPVKTHSRLARELVVAKCVAAGWPQPRVYETSKEDPGTAQARSAIEDGASLILVGGGDGTVRLVAEVLTGLDAVDHTHVPADRARPSRVPLGLIPLGTGNLLARNLEMDVDNLGANVDTALFGYQRWIDTGSMEVFDDDVPSRHTFLVMAGIGFDAKMVSDTRDDLKKNVGWLAYGESGFRHLPGHRTRVTLALDDRAEEQRKIRSVLFGNCGKLPGGIDFIPGALLDDGELDVVVMSPRSAFGWVLMLGKVVFRHRRSLPILDYDRAKTIGLRCQEPLETQADGDPTGPATSVSVTVAPRSLLVRVPSGMAVD